MYTDHSNSLKHILAQSSHMINNTIGCVQSVGLFEYYTDRMNEKKFYTDIIWASTASDDAYIREGRNIFATSTMREIMICIEEKEERGRLWDHSSNC